MHGFFERRLEQGDSIVSAAIRLELTRQQDQIELIASENIVSPAVLAAQGTRQCSAPFGCPGQRCRFTRSAATWRHHSRDVP